MILSQFKLNLFPIGNIYIFVKNFITMIDIDKSKKETPKINRRAILQELENIPNSFFEFTSNEVSNYSLNHTKTGITSDISPRALNRWIEQGVVVINDSDKGKTKRFNRLESIWIKIAIELRKFGVSLNDLKYIRTQLFEYTLEDFSMFKFKILKNILDTPEYLTIDDEHQIGFYPYKYYSDKVSKGFLFSHINIRFIDFLREEFPNNSFDTNFNIKEVGENIDKVSLLFYLKTNTFTEIRITLSDGDTRLLNNSSELKNNKSLLKAIQNWTFQTIEIQLDDGVKFTIEN